MREREVVDCVTEGEMTAIEALRQLRLTEKPEWCTHRDWGEYLDELEGQEPEPVQTYPLFEG